jgi:site-specific DNA recombinase
MGKAAFRKTKRVRRIKKTKLAIESKYPLRSEFSSPRDRPKEEWIYISVPAIIDEKTFEYAQIRLQSNIKLSPRNNKKYSYLLSGLLRCKTCGYSIYGKPASTSKYKRLYYRCMGQDGYRWPQGRVCQGHPVRTEAVDELVWESVKGLLLEPQALIKEYQNRLGRPSQEPIIDSKLIDLRRLKAERSRLIDLFESGLVEKDEIESKLKSNRAKIEQVENEISYLKKEKREREQVLTVIRNLEDFSAKIKENLHELDFERKKQIVRLLVEEVEIDAIKEEINVKHIIPLDNRKCQLRTGTQQSPLRCTRNGMYHHVFL